MEDDMADTAITRADVENFVEKLKERDRTRTPETARKSLIESGVLDKDGKPRWPTEGKKRAGSKAK
jgi:hypothetical protein